jgi:hypothetical protein
MISARREGSGAAGFAAQDGRNDSAGGIAASAWMKRRRLVIE